MCGILVLCQALRVIVAVQFQFSASEQFISSITQHQYDQRGLGVFRGLCIPFKVDNEDKFYNGF